MQVWDSEIGSIFHTYAQLPRHQFINCAKLLRRVIEVQSVMQGVTCRVWILVAAAEQRKRKLQKHTANIQMHILVEQDNSSINKFHL